MNTFQLTLAFEAEALSKKQNLARRSSRFCEQLHARQTLPDLLFAHEYARLSWDRASGASVEATRFAFGKLKTKKPYVCQQRLSNVTSQTHETTVFWQTNGDINGKGQFNLGSSTNLKSLFVHHHQVQGIVMPGDVPVVHWISYKYMSTTRSTGRRHCGPKMLCISESFR